MEQICKHSDCTGCGACAGVCPRHCISMVPNPRYRGGIYPKIDTAQCIDCKRCEAVCPNCHAVARERPKECFAAWNLCAADRESSTSGGIGMALSQEVVKNGGVVYGAAVAGAGVVEHIRVERKDELHRLQKSKYVHSHISAEIYQQLVADRKAGKLILFTGTPCQTAAAKSFLREYDRLFLVDIVCHGVPPQQILKDHIRWKTRTKVSSFTTRDKGEFCLTLYDEEHRMVYQKNFPDDEYEYGFMYAMFYRPNCYQCKYACMERCGDLTIGDFWGLKATDYPKEKVSEILVNTEKGVALLAMCRDRLFLDRRTVEEAVAGNAQLRQPSRKNYLYTLFSMLYPVCGYRVAINVAYLKFRLMSPLYKFYNM